MHPDVLIRGVTTFLKPGEAPGQADRTGSRALWATAKTNATAANQGLARGQDAPVPGGRSSTAGNQARGARKGVTRRQLQRVTNA